MSFDKKKKKKERNITKTSPLLLPLYPHCLIKRKERERKTRTVPDARYFFVRIIIIRTREKTCKLPYSITSRTKRRRRRGEMLSWFNY
jgi:hypothetical protein